MDPALHSQAFSEVQAELAALKQQIALLESVAAYHQARSGALNGHHSKAIASQSAHSSTSSDSRKEFVDMGQREAAIAVMRRHAKPMRTGDVARAMIAGGFPWHRTHANLSNSLFTSFSRGPTIFSKVSKGLWVLIDESGEHEQD